MGAAEVIANYEALAALTGRMHETALRGDWDALVAMEQDRGRMIETMKPLDAAMPLDAAARERKRELIAAVLAQDEEIRAATRSWMDQLQAERQSSLRQIRLLKEYGA